MIDFSNPTVAAVTGAIVGGAVTLIVALLMFKLNREKREITTIYRDFRPLTFSSHEYKNRIKLILDGTEIDDLVQYEITIKCSGNKEIMNFEYYIDSPMDGNIIQHDVKVVPHHAGAKFEYIDSLGRLKIEIPHLNPGDYIRLNILFSGDPDGVRPYCNLPGVSTRTVRPNEQTMALAAQLSNLTPFYASVSVISALLQSGRPRL